MAMVTIRLVAILLPFTAILAACIAHDGPFEQISGPRIDQQAIRALVAKAADRADVVAHLGSPQKTRLQSGEKEILSYVSVRRRVAYHTTLGIRHSESSQDLIEYTTLAFDKGKLVDVQFKSETR